MGILEWLIMLGGVTGSALWLYSDLKNRIPGSWALGVSFGLMLVVYLITRGIAGLLVPEHWFKVLDPIPELIGAGSAIFVSVAVARPVSKSLRKKMG